MLAALVAISALSCRRPLGQPRDAGGDGGAPSVGDGGRLDASAGDLPVDVAGDLVGETAGPPDGAGDAPPAVCPAGVTSLDVCGCGCCEVEPATLGCYYPSQGESRDTIPNPMPTPQQCATMGCSLGERYFCCADPGPEPPAGAIFCGVNVSKEDLLLWDFTKRDGEVCTTIEIGLMSGQLQISTPRGFGIAGGWRGPCAGGTSAGAIGGLGSVSQRPARAGDTTGHYDVHVALFFSNGTGIADVERIDVDDIAPALCTATGCGCAGACAFDATYRYGFTGGLAAWRDTVILTPPAGYQHVRSPVTTMPADMTCAPAPPVCGSPTIDVADLMTAFGDADVQDAFTRSIGAGTLPFYGARVPDMGAFQITRDGGGGFQIGSPCPAGSDPSSCLEIPGGLGRLESLLRAFDAQQLTDPSCAPLAR